MYTLETQSITVPAGGGIDAFLAIIKNVLQLPRVKKLELHDQSGVALITYQRYVAEGEVDNQDYASIVEAVSPAQVLSTLPITSIDNVPDSAPFNVLSQLFQFVAMEKLVPVAFVVGDMERLNTWYGSKVKGSLHGWPVIVDASISETALVLCASYKIGSLLSESVCAFQAVLYLPGGG